MSIEQPEARKQPGVAREYANDHIVVEWEPPLCIHSARCLKALPRVFNTRSRPWVNLDGAAAGDIAAAVMQCPTGALRFRRVDDGAQEAPSEPTVIEARPNCPYFVRGRVTVINQDKTERVLPRAALCRCGHSENKPFCDGSHRRVGFKTTAE
ncbi:MAG: (4Fe-4S)-binding protein [Anaerolineales bacterium]